MKFKPVKKKHPDRTLLCGDCLVKMQGIPDTSVDLILCDLPYGMTKNSWDCEVPLDALWKEYKRVIKDNGAIILFAGGLFTAKLMMSNTSMYRYNLVWDKVLPSGFLNANRMPMRVHEDICVFYKKPPIFNPQKTLGTKNHSKGTQKDPTNNNYGDYAFVDNAEELGNLKNPTSILTFSKPHPSKSNHPTEKPVALLEYLIKTYTNEGSTVLDNCMGSGSTGVACVNTNRSFIGIELSEEYFDIACQRITTVVNSL